YLGGRWITGAFAAVFGALSGGIGFLAARGPHLVFRHELRTAAVGRYWGDLMYRRSYHLALQNLAPPLPRDLTYAVFPAFLLLVAKGLRERDPLWLWLAGGVLGIEGLMGAEAFVVGLGVAVLVSILPLTVPRRQVAAALFIPALGLWALWAVPLFIHYAQYRGFRDLLSAPVSLPPWDILGGWGIATPFAVAGGLLFLKRWRSDPGIHVATVLLVAAAVPMLASIVLPHVRGFSTIERDQRYWPLFFLGVAMFAALGATRLLDWVVRRRRGFAVVTGLALLAMAVPSTVLATVAYVRER